MRGQAFDAVILAIHLIAASVTLILPSLYESYERRRAVLSGRLAGQEVG